MEVVDIPASTKRKRKAGDDENYEGDDEDKEKDELAEDEASLDDFVYNKGLAPKGGTFEYAEYVMRFGSFAWAYGSFWGREDQERILSMVRPLIRLELAHGFKVSVSAVVPTLGLTQLFRTAMACQVCRSARSAG